MFDVVSLLLEHTKTVHLAKFSSLGLSITTPGVGQAPAATPAQSPGGQKRPLPAEPGPVRTPPTKVLVQPRAPTPRGRGRARGGLAPPRLPAGAVQVKPEPPLAAVGGATGAGTGAEAGAGAGAGAGGKSQERMDPVIKCNDCAQFIKQSGECMASY